ncbi:DNA-binding phage protein [Streptococcus canis]|nr:DNA-binding phage protein [Streptococcus canis]
MLILGKYYVGKNHKIMLERNLNMNKLAKLTGIHKSHFSDLKSGKNKKFVVAQHGQAIYRIKSQLGRI